MLNVIGFSIIVIDISRLDLLIDDDFFNDTAGAAVVVVADFADGASLRNGRSND